MATKRDLEILDRNNNLLLDEIMGSMIVYKSHMKIALDNYRDAVYAEIKQTSIIDHNELLIYQACEKGLITEKERATVYKYIKARNAEANLEFRIKQIEEELKSLARSNKPADKEVFYKLIKEQGELKNQQYTLPQVIEGHKQTLMKSNPVMANEILKYADIISHTTFTREKITKAHQNNYSKRIMELLERNEQDIVKTADKYKANKFIFEQKRKEAQTKANHLKDNVLALYHGYDKSEKVRFEVESRAERRAKTHVEVKEVEVEIEEPTK